MKIKRVVSVMVAAAVALCFAACKTEKHNERAEALSGEAVKLIEWYKAEKVGENADISELDAATDDAWSGGRVLSNAEISVVGFAKYYGVSGDYDAYFSKLETAFGEVFSDKGTVKTASPGTLYMLARTVSLLGKDPRGFCGVDLIKAATSENAAYKSIYSTPYVLTAVEEFGLRESEKALVDSTVEWLFTEQNDDGGWGVDYMSGDPLTDPDTTAMVLAGLAPFVSASDARIVKAWDKLKTFASESGAYRSAYSDASSDTTAEVLTAAVAAGKDPYGDEFSVGGKNIIDVILTFKNDDGGLRAGADDAPSSEFTVQNVLDAFYRTSVYLNSLKK